MPLFATGDSSVDLEFDLVLPVKVEAKKLKNCFFHLHFNQQTTASTTAAFQQWEQDCEHTCVCPSNVCTQLDCCISVSSTHLLSM